MKKTLLILSMFLTLGMLSSCSDDDDTVKTPTLSFAAPNYVLSADGEIDVILTASSPVLENTTVDFNLLGEAVEDEDFQLSAKSFEFKKGDASAKITIKSFENYEANRSIIIKLITTPGYDMGDIQQTIVGVTSKEKVIYSFAKEYLNLTETVTVELDLKTLKGKFNGAEEVKIPFTIDAASTGVESEHYSIEGDAKEFVFAPGESTASITINFIKAEADKDLLVLNIGDLGAGYVLGNYVKTNVKIYGPTTFGKMFGKWEFVEMINKDWLPNNCFSVEDGQNLPFNNTKADILEFIAGENASLKPTMTGDLSKYFRDCTVEYVEERKERFQYTGYPPMREKITVLKMSKANVAFSATDISERETLIGFRVLDEGETLEVTVFDYEPTEFLVASYKDMIDYATPTMLYYGMYFKFKKVNE